jgi:hypothetical protein
MTKTESSWIKVGRNADARALREEVKKLKLAWPDRWEFRVLPRKSQDDRSYDLYLRHR